MTDRTHERTNARIHTYKTEWCKYTHIHTHTRARARADARGQTHTRGRMRTDKQTHRRTQTHFVGSPFSLPWTRSFFTSIKVYCSCWCANCMVVFHTVIKICIYTIQFFSALLSFARNSGGLTRVRHSSRWSSAIHSYQFVQCFRVSRQ